MTVKEKIKSALKEKVREEDYERFKADWQYDSETEQGIHKSGLKVNLIVLDEFALEMPNLLEWEQKLSSAGVSRDEIEKYRAVLQDQFTIISDKNPYEEQKETREELEEWFENHEKFILDCARKNGRTDEEIEKMSIEIRQHHMNLLKER